jgi:hypothetical protein
MSWSVSAIGKAKPVADKLAADFAKITFCSPEETAVKDAAAAVVAKALENTTNPAVCVKVEASGSEDTSTDADGNKQRSQSVSLRVDKIYGFVEG